MFRALIFPLFSRVRENFSRLDPGFLVVVVICLLAIWPFLSRAGLPQASDAELHIFRLAELSRLFRGGEFFPRWAPNFYYGYGYPIFNYYAPFVYYLGLAFELLPLLEPVEAVKILFVLGFLLGGVGLYGYMREVWGRAAGIVAAVSYLFAPYLLYIDPHARGDLAEVFSYALFPLALWSMERLRQTPSALNWVASSLLVAALIMTHNLMAMVFVTMLLGWTIWQEIVHQVPGDLENTNKLFQFAIRTRLFLTLIAAIGVAAVFWLVVALEQDAVNLSSLIGDGSHFDYRNHFLSFGELLSNSRMIDWGASGPSYVLNIGVSQYLLAFVGLIVIATGWVRARRQVLFFIVSAFILLFLMLPASGFVWETVPLLPFLQFPWRLLGPLAVVLAIIAGVGIDGLYRTTRFKTRVWIPAMAVAFTMLLALPLLQVAPWPEDFGPTTAGRVLAEELAGRWLGTTSTADFVPATVDVLPQPEESILKAIFQNRTVDRVNRVTLPSGTTVISRELTPLKFEYQVSGDKDFPLRLFLFDFPGWKAQIDNKIVEKELGRPEGFIVIPVPAGNHLVQVEFGITGPRLIATVITIFSLIFIALVALLFYSRRQMIPSESLEARSPYSRSENKFLWPVLALTLSITFVNILVIEPRGILHRDYDGISVQAADHHVFVDFGEQIALIGYDIPDKAVGAGDTVPVTAYWKLLNEPTTNYQVFVHIFDLEGNLVAQSDKLNPGEIPARRWPEDKYVIDAHEINLPSDLNPGNYEVAIGLWVAAEGWRLPVVDKTGNSLGDSYIMTVNLVVE